jgi:hypothetical protein
MMLDVIDFKQTADLFMENGVNAALFALIVYMATRGFSVMAALTESITKMTAENAALTSEQTAALRAMSDAVGYLTQEIRMLSDRSLVRARD